MKKKIILTIFILFSSFIHTEERIAVLNLKGININNDIVESVTETLMTSIAEYKKYKVIERAQIDRIFNELNLTNTNDFEEDTIIDIGKLAKAKKILVGSVSKVGNKYIINVRVIEVETGKVEFATNIACESKNDIFKTTILIAKAISGMEEIDSKIVKSDNPSDKEDKIQLEDIEIPKYIFQDDFKIYNKSLWYISKIRIEPTYGLPMDSPIEIITDEKKIKFYTPLGKINDLITATLWLKTRFKPVSFSTEISFRDLNLSSQSISLIIGTDSEIGKGVKVTADIDKEYYAFFRGEDIEWLVDDDINKWSCNQDKIIGNIFGDEDKKFHTLKIVYDAENKIIYGFVDNILIDYIKDYLFPRDQKLFLKIRVFDNYKTGKKGDLNIELDNFKSSIDFNKLTDR